MQRLASSLLRPTTAAATARRAALSPFANCARNPPVRILAMPLSTHTVPPLKDPTLFKTNAFVDGAFVPAASGQTFAVTDPASGLHIADCPEMTASETASAVAVAASALKTFRTTTARERSRMLRRWYEQMMANADDLATIITWENGKPLADARGEILYAAGFLEWFAEEAPRIYGDTIPVAVKTNRVVTVRQPVGVCGLITPWNFPAAMITRKIGPALAAGCTVVCKAPGETPFTSLALAELANRAGIPPGVINIVTTLANTPQVGEELCTNPVVKKVSFTGSTAVGKLLMKQASGTLKKLSFELGGNAPFIVFDDVRDLSAAVSGAIASKFRSSGQTCVCANRIYVQAGIYDAFAAEFAQQVQKFRVGSGYDPSTTHGPLIHARAVAKVHEHVQDALAKGASALVGGRPRADLGENFFEPTVLRDMTPDMRVHGEETFGPLAALFRFETEREVVEMANAAQVGLAGYFFSGDVARCWRVAEALDVGMVGINTGVISDVAAPFGGVKESGFGREGSKYGVDEFTVLKTMTFGGVGELQG